LERIKREGQLLTFCVQLKLLAENEKEYWYRFKKREDESNEIELSTFCRSLKLEVVDAQGFDENKEVTKRREMNNG